MQTIPPNLFQMVHDLEMESSDPSFWDTDNKARQEYVTSQLQLYGRLLSRVTMWTQLKEDCDAAYEILQAEQEVAAAAAAMANTNMNRNTNINTTISTESTPSTEWEALYQELYESSQKLISDGERYQLDVLLSGPYDTQPCRLLITAGAGGTEATDWVSMLRRMYERHAEQMGYTVQIEEEQPGDVVGYKSVELVITGGGGCGDAPHHPYGWFKGEKGAHRLVRLSPFNANNKRQTTFAGVDVAPILNEHEYDLEDINIPDKDLEITTMRSGGAGGQNVNKVNSAVRIKHLPSGLNVKCTQERSQAMNKDLAMKRLKAQLLAIAKEQRVLQIQEIRGDQVEASWGAQIRNYVLHPYKMVKDQRTGWETSDAQGFLDGDLGDCIAALLRHRAKEEQDTERRESISTSSPSAT